MELHTNTPIPNNMSQPPVWFITGCSSGFGFSLARHVLKSGHRAIATSRVPSKTPELVSEIESLGGIWRPLDVTDPEADLALAIARATAVYGCIDILVNCAAYALLGAFEMLRCVLYFQIKLTESCKEALCGKTS